VRVSSRKHRGTTHHNDDITSVHQDVDDDSDWRLPRKSTDAVTPVRSPNWGRITLFFSRSVRDKKQDGIIATETTAPYVLLQEDGEPQAADVLHNGAGMEGGL